MLKIKKRKFRLKKLLVIKVIAILVGVIIGFRLSRVDAGMYDAGLDKNLISGIYAITEFDGVDKILYFHMYSINGKPVYSIELGGKAPVNVYHSTSDFSLSNLTEEQIRYVREVSYYGYGYEGHDDKYYYMATQEIIWEYLSGKEIFWTSQMSVVGKEIDITTYKEEIFNLLSHSSAVFDLDIEESYMVGDYIVIDDKNGVLNEYEIVSSLYSDVYIRGNSLVIKVANKVGRDKIELKRKGYYEYDSILYYCGSAQKMISNGNYRTVDEVIEFDINGAKVVASVVRGNANGISSSDAILEGARYALYSEDGMLVGKYESDINGQFIIENLEMGKYYFEHTRASEGYLLNKDIVEFVVMDDNLEITLEQILIRREVQINKVYGSNGEYFYEDGVLFSIYDEMGEIKTKISTNSEGVAKVVLPYGHYKVVQNNTIYGYSKADDFFINIVDNNEDIIHFNLVNELILVNVRINTYDSESLERIVSCDIGYKIIDKEKNSYLEFNGVDIFYADSSGTVVVPIKLDYGEYILEQVSIPSGLKQNSSNIYFNINSKSNLELIDGNFVMEIDVYNKIIDGVVNIKTLKEVYYKKFNNYWYELEARNNVEFNLISMDDIVINGELIYESGDVVYSGKTNDKGELIINKLYLGSYCLESDNIEQRRCFVIDEESINVNLEYVENLKKGNIIINNTSSDGSPLNGSIFEITDNNDDVIYTGITNEEGIVKVEDVLLGDYCIRQKSVRDGYYVLENEECFLLEEEKTLNIVSEENINTVISVPDTFSKEKFGLYEIFVIISLVGVGYIVYKKVFKSKLYR